MTLTTFIESSISKLPEYNEMYEQDLSLSALCNRFKKDGYVQVHGCFNFSGGGDTEKAIRDAINYLIECEGKGYFMPDDKLVEISNYVFKNLDLRLAEWSQMNDHSCGAWVQDICGNSHNVQQWYEDGSYNLL